MSRPIWFLSASLCALLAMALLWPGLGGAFIFDDLPNIVENTRLHLNTLSLDKLRHAAFSYQPGGGSRPLAMLSFSLDYWRGGGANPAVFKQTSLAIHGLTVLALGAMLRRLLKLAQWPQPRTDLMALGVALVWGIHPLHVSSVLYVVQRMQTLSTLFLVLALWAYLGARQAQQENRPSLKQWCLFALSGLLGLACKEDVVLLPLFTLVLELTLLGFRSADPRQAAWWRRGYQLFVALGAAVFFLVVVPAYWTSGPYDWRNFSSLERLLTQGRVLVMYLAQIILPLPKYLPFYYDQLEPSRGLLSPWETLPSLLLLAGLLAWAWHWRARRPVFAIGVLFFFVGHFLTSNVLNLELAFEHRNHFPLIGILLALGDLACLTLDRFRLSRGAAVLMAAAAVLTLCMLTFVRASIWGSPLQFALEGPNWAANSARAWQLLCKTYYNRSGGDPEHPFFTLAINSCQTAATLPNGLTSLADLITLKTLKGQNVEDDWRAFQDRLQHGVITPEGRDVLWIMIGNANKGVALDSQQVVQAIVIFAARIPLAPVELANLADYVLYQSDVPEQAYSYYQKAVREARPGDPLVQRILGDLRQHGMKEWADRLKKELPG